LRKGAASAANSINVVLTKIRYMGGWAKDSNVVHDYIDPNTKSKTFKETHNLKSGRIWCIGTQNVENGYKRAFFARLGEGLKKY
jgi:hypothetical protein